MNPNGHCFPAPVYAETVLSVNFEDAQKLFLDPLLEIHYAHTLMLTRQRILSAEEAARLCTALDNLDRNEILRSRYDGSCEDLFFFIENLLVDSCGVDLAGKMHTARSRNDIAVTLYRMVLRKDLLAVSKHLLELRGIMLDLAARHTATLMPAHTHTQPAQPTTLAHYLLACTEVMGRDAGRLKAAFTTVNRSPLGACAITTTGFPIDRSETARLLGFEALQLNSYGAIAAIDYITESAASLAVAMIDLGKIVQDMLLWSTQEFGFLRLSDGYVQISSIMPQKRNPVPLEHVRVLASRALGEAQAIFTTAHNTPFGDINDSEDDLQPLVYTAFTDATRALRLFAGALQTADFDRKRMRAAAARNFLTATELADTLVREENLSFREAHQLVATAVKSAQSDDPDAILASLEAAAEKELGRSLKTPGKHLRSALDPQHFVEIRRIPGGPAPEATADQLAIAQSEQNKFVHWLKSKSELLENYPRLLHEHAARLVSGTIA